MEKEVFIEVNRSRMILMTIIYGVIGLASFLIIYYWGESQEWLSPGVFKTVSVIVLLFFAVIAGTFAKNIKNKSAGLHITRAGIDDQTSNIGIGLIRWKDVKEVELTKQFTSQYLVVKVKKSQRYIDQAKNSAIRRVLNQNMAIYKTPVVINIGILNATADEIKQMVIQHSGKFTA